jgi:hypothetical protein
MIKMKIKTTCEALNCEGQAARSCALSEFLKSPASTFLLRHCALRSSPPLGAPLCKTPSSTKRTVDSPVLTEKKRQCELTKFIAQATIKSINPTPSFFDPVSYEEATSTSSLSPPSSSPSTTLLILRGRFRKTRCSRGRALGWG